MTEDEAKACSVFVWACKEETAAPSDNHGQKKLGGTITQMDFHLCHLYSKKKIGLLTVSATQLHPAFLLDKCCFDKPVSNTTPQKQRLQKRSCTAKSLVSKWEHLITPHRGKVFLFFVPAPLRAWGREGPLFHLRRAGGRKCVAEAVCNQVLLPSSTFLKETFSESSAEGGQPWRDSGIADPTLQKPSFAS